MKEKLVTIVVMMLMISLAFSTLVSAGSEEDPEIVDRTFDVKLFGILPFFPQLMFKNADFISVWFYEEESNPDYLYICMKTRSLISNTDTYDFIYVVDWTYNNVRYGASIHLLPSGVTPLVAGSLDAEGNDYVDYVICDGSYNDETGIITWIIPKSNIGSPNMATKITNILAVNTIRFPLDSGKPKMDLFKDFSWNAKITKDYTIRY